MKTVKTNRNPEDRTRQEPKATRPPVRLVTMMWGDSYCEKLLDITLPAILAPGNLPALAREFECELAIVTETRLFESLREAPVVREVARHCRLKLVPVDDLIANNAGYGMALTYALHRGFEDLGADMVSTFLVFFNADFVLADGSYEVMAKHMLKGERLIFSPSYCVNAEALTPILEDAVDPDSHVMAIDKRSMAATIMEHRHNTILAKTVNRPYYHMHVTDQFYWQANTTTMLGHQLPIAIVCMMPQKIYTDPICFWDYATISMACPTANRCVLGDSDDFLMIELREKDTFLELMTIGRNKVDEIAKGLADYMTADQFEMGRYSLTLHATDLDDTVEFERAKLQKFVDSVYERLPIDDPVSARNHRFWVGQQKDQRNSRRGAKLHDEAASYRRVLVEAAQAMPPAPEKGADVVVVKGTQPRARGPLDYLYATLLGSVPRVTRWHPLWADLHFVVEKTREALGGRDHRLIVCGKESQVTSLVKDVPGSYLEMTPFDIFQSNIPMDAGDFDLCFCDLEWVEINEYPRLFDVIAPRMRAGGVFIAYHAGDVMRGLQRNGVALFNDIAPRQTGADFYFGGSWASAVAQDEFRSRVMLLAEGKVSKLSHMAYLLRSLWRFRRANSNADRTAPDQISDMRTSFVMVTDL